MIRAKITLCEMRVYITIDRTAVVVTSIGSRSTAAAIPPMSASKNPSHDELYIVAHGLGINPFGGPLSLPPCAWESAAFQASAGPSASFFLGDLVTHGSVKRLARRKERLDGCRRRWRAVAIGAPNIFDHQPSSGCNGSSYCKGGKIFHGDCSPSPHETMRVLKLGSAASASRASRRWALSYSPFNQWGHLRVTQYSALIGHARAGLPAKDHLR